ncbi:hypothetical protein STEG23_033955, partial [Scotinomys teguina]
MHGVGNTPLKKSDIKRKMKATSKSKEKMIFRPRDVCDGVCKDNTAPCFQSCPPESEGNMKFACKAKKWHKVTETCHTLNAASIFEEDVELYSVQPSESTIALHESHRQSQTITGMLMEKCPKDFSCIIRSIEKSPRIPGNIAVVVDLLHNISTAPTREVSEKKMESYSAMANHILNSKSISNWTFVQDRNSSCVLLQSINSFASKLFVKEHPINISHVFIHTMGTIMSRDSIGKNFTFSMRINDTSDEVIGRLLLTSKELQKVPSPSQVISIAFPTLGAILEASLLENMTVNGLVLSVILPKELEKISLMFEKISKAEGRKSQCVGWHSLESRWDHGACQLMRENSQHAVCRCRPSKSFTSFSILMSPDTLENPVLIYITYIGLGISICSLIICLSIEALVWSQVTKTEISYLRHLCIANIAATLLMADVWFIVASFLSGPISHHNGCVAATFFVHFFYLAVFFWMLAKALLILYGILIVFHTLPKSFLVASLFSVGYGCPLVIAVITLAVTEPRKGYLRPEACWLNWDMTKALLAFVVPALAIVVVNLITVTLVVIKTQRAAIGSSMFQEVRAIVRICKNIAILTPLLGLTWGFGIATVVDSRSLAFHIIFSLLNALQGFFILVFGTILDPKIREALKSRVASAKWISRVSEDKDEHEMPPWKHKFSRIQDKCRGPCTSPSNCNQSCASGFHGEIVFTCNQNKWQKTIETCTSLSVDTLFQGMNPALSLSLASSSVFPMNLVSSTMVPVNTGNVLQRIHKSCPKDYVCIVDAVKSSDVTSGNIAFIVELLKNISSGLETYNGIHGDVTREKMKNYGKMANHILNKTAISNWTYIPNKNASSDLLESVNSFAKKLQIHSESEDVVDELFIQTKGARIFPGTSENSFNLSMPVHSDKEDVLVIIEIPRQTLRELPSNVSQAIGIAFPTLGAILKEVHGPNTNPSKSINGLVLSLVLPEGLQEIILTFEKISKSQSTSSQCVRWHSEKRQWDESPCKTVWDTQGTVNCLCNYSRAGMSFSILMSSKPVRDKALNYITFIGLSVSIFSLVLCLAIEGVVWSRVVITEISYMRHVCIVNIAVSLLTANVWFVIGSNANVQEDHKWCVAVTFFSHFFFLSLFFWMLFKALLIVYGILVVFRRMMKSRMMAIGFVVGYGCPLVIAVITVTVTEPGEGYTRKDACWLNWNQTKALYAFVIPALAIVAVNFLVVLAVAINTQRPLIGSSKSQDMAIVIRISKNVAILTPLLGLTWGFGLATLLEGTHLVVHVIFALLNAFQGFFILLFGTIMDHKIRDALRMRVSSLKGKSRAVE